MTYNNLTLVVLLLLLPSVALSQGFRVLGGEHEGFTRLVVYGSQETSWSVEKVSPGVFVVVAEGHLGGYNIQDAFDRITRKRISEIRSNNTQLEVMMPCDCEISSEVFSDGLLILDISERVVVDEKSNSLRIGQSLDFSQFSSEDILPINSIEVEKTRSETSSERTVVEQQWPSESASQTFDENFSNESDLNQLLGELGSQVAIASTGGILNPVLPIRNFDDSDLREVNRVVTDLGESPEEVESAIGSNVRFNSSGQMEFQPNVSFGTDAQVSEVCPARQSYDIAEWGGSGDYSIEVSSRSRPLFGNTDAIDAEEMELLIRRLLYFGFAAEAKKLLQGFQGNDNRKASYNQVAQALEFEPLRSHQPLPYAHCQSVVAIWSILLHPGPIGEGGMNMSVILQELSRMPAHLREGIGRNISERFVSWGLREEAEDINEILRRNSKSLDLSIRTGTPVKENLISNDILSEVAALMDRVSYQIEEKGTASREDSILLASYFYELREYEISQDVGEALILSMIYSDQFEEIFELIDRDESGYFTTEISVSVRDQIWTQLSEVASNSNFLELVFGRVLSGKEELPALSRDAVGSRLLELGFIRESSLLLGKDEEVLASNYSEDLSSDSVANDSTAKDFIDDVGNFVSFNVGGTQQTPEGGNTTAGLEVFQNQLEESQAARLSLRDLLSNSELAVGE